MYVEDTGALPKRLRQLRLELGWTLEEVAQVVDAGSKGVVSNWETSTDRRRTPPLGTLMSLARWYGVSLDYLCGVRGADRDSPPVRIGKAALKERFLPELKRLNETTPGARFGLAVAILESAAPEAFFPARIAANLLLSEEDLARILGGGIPTDQVLERMARFADLPVSWFYLRPDLL